MDYTYLPKEYTKQIQAYYELEKLSFSPCDSREHVLEALEERNRKKNVIADITNTMIREYIETFENDPKAMTDRDAEKLHAFYSELTDPGTRRSRDLGISMRLLRLLKEYARSRGDLVSYVDVLQDCIANEIRLFGNHSNSFPGSCYADECLQLAERIEELPQEKRVTFYATMFRLCCCQEKGCEAAGTMAPMEVFLRIDQFLRNHGAMEDPALWEAVASQGIAYNILLIFNAHCIWERQHGRPSDAERFRERLESYIGILRKQLTAGEPILYAERPAIESYVLRADYHLGRITVDELLNGLTCLQSRIDPQDTPVVQASRLAQINYYYLLYLYRFSDYDEETVTALSRARIQETLPRILQISREAGSTNFNLYILLFITGASYTASFEDFASLVLEMTVYSDKALFIHTIMVRELSRVIFDWVIENRPESFSGVAGYGAAEIRDHVNELRTLMDDCCMFHDIGKFFMLDIVENAMRRLTDDEFRLIRSHPEAFEDIYENWSQGNERFMCIHDCAITHHLWHDGSKGYPRVAQTKNRPFADILTIADGLDAATDSYGRPYRASKTLDALIAEFQSGAGTQYGQEAAAALSDPGVRDRLERLVSEGRKDIYYQIYTGNRP